MASLEMTAAEGGIFQLNSNLQDIADRLSELVGNPITIESRDFELIAHSRQVSDVDDVRKETILRRRVPEPVVRALWTTGVVENLLSSRTAVRVERLESVGLAGRVAMAVRVADEAVAHIWVQEINRPLDDQDLLLLQQAANMVALELLNVGYLRETRERMLANFLDELLVASSVDEAEAHVRGSRLGLSLPDSYRLIVVGDGKGVDERAGDRAGGDSREWLQTATDTAFRLGAWSVATRHPGHATVVVSAAGERRDELHVARAVCEALTSRGHDVIVCASEKEHGFQRLSHAYKYTMRFLRVAALLGWRNTVVTSCNLGVLQLLPHLENAYNTVFGAGAGHASLKRLLSEEQEQPGFSMLETVEAFLDCGGDAKKTARRLHIHVNTLNYRLRRIVDKTGLNLADGQERLAIHLELKLRRLFPRRKEAG